MKEQRSNEFQIYWPARSEAVPCLRTVRHVRRPLPAHIGQHFHNQARYGDFLLHCCVSGWTESEQEIPSRRLTRSEVGSVLLTDCRKPYRLLKRASQGDREEYLLLGFDMGSTAAFPVPPLPGERYRIADPDGRIREQMRAAINAAFNYGEAGFWAAQGSLMHIMHILQHIRYDDHFSARIGCENTDNLISQAKQLISESVQKPFTVKEIAQFCGCSERSLYRKFKSDTGETIKSYQQHRRAAALRHALDAEGTAEQVARDFHFESTPSMWRFLQQFSTE